jgi:hypothetical protein
MRFFGSISTGVVEARKIAYRWQARLESKGFTTPPIVRAVARRLF